MPEKSGNGGGAAWHYLADRTHVVETSKTALLQSTQTTYMNKRCKPGPLLHLDADATVGLIPMIRRKVYA